MNLSQRKDTFSSKISINSSELATIICYPKFSSEEYTDRLNEMHLLGIKDVLLDGKTKIGNMGIAGKGCVSLVVKAEVADKMCAIKIRRTDANRMSMKREAYLHTIANSVGVGPNLFAHTKNFIVMEFIDGMTIIDWIRQQNLSRDKVRNVIIRILEICFNLDKVHLDHGELSRLDRHVIISRHNNTKIVDFESSSIERKPCNVTAAAQSLLLNGIVSKRVNNLLNFPKSNEIIRILKSYKHEQTRDNFNHLIQIVLMA
jgi:putative serine/threonine protein kinase